MITIYEITANPCRDIVEGRTPRRVLKTVPWREPVLTPKPASVIDYAALKLAERHPSEIANLGNHHGNSGRFGKAAIAKWFKDFHALIGDAGFTSKDLAIYFTQRGWQCRQPEENAIQHLRRRERQGSVRTNGKKDGCIVWQFTQAPDAKQLTSIIE